MKTKHTPGPWEINTREEVEIGESWPKFYEVSAIDSSHWLCRVLSRNGKREEAEANAAVMAVAPEMLDLLIRIEMCLNDKIPIEFNDPFHKSINDVIKKATS